MADGALGMKITQRAVSSIRDPQVGKRVRFALCAPHCSFAAASCNVPHTRARAHCKRLTFTCLDFSRHDEMKATVLAGHWSFSSAAKPLRRAAGGVRPSLRPSSP